MERKIKFKSLTVPKTVDHLDFENFVRLLRDYQGLKFVGNWTMFEDQDIKKMSPYFDSQKGKVIFSFTTEDFFTYEKYTYMTIRLRCFNGFTINENVEFTSNFSLQNCHHRVLEREIDANKEIGFIFTKLSLHYTKMKFRLELLSDDHDNSKRMSLILTPIIFPGVKLRIDLSSTSNARIDQWKMLNYWIVSMIVCISHSINLYNVRRKLVHSLQEVDTISIMSTWWSAIWMMFLFFIHISYFVSEYEYLMFILPSAIFLITLIMYQIPLIITIWEIRLVNWAEQRRKLPFISFILSLFIVSISNNNDTIFMRVWVVYILNSCVWIPQIVLNAKNKLRNTPSPLLWISGSWWQALMPVYIMLFEDNIFEIRGDPLNTWVLIAIHSISMIMLTCQRFFGIWISFPEHKKDSRWMYALEFILWLGHTSTDDQIVTDKYGASEGSEAVQSTCISEIPDKYSEHDTGSPCNKIWISCEDISWTHVPLSHQT